MHPHHVIIVTPQFDGRDGISAVARQFAAVFAPIAGERRLEVWSLGDTFAPPAFDKAAVFHGAGGRRLAFASLALRRSHLRDALVVVTHVHLLPVVLPLMYRGAKVVPVLEGVEAWKPLRPLEARALTRAWRVLAISHHTMTRFWEANPALGAVPIEVCHPSVPEAAAPTPARVPGRFALIVARMADAERYKGHDLLLRIWPRVRDSIADAELVIAGDGTDRPRLEARAVELGIAAAVRFTGRLDDADLAACYRDAALFVMPSRDEGFGLVFLEAMRARTPCIAAHGAAEEIVRDQVDGLIVPHDDARALTQAIVRLFADAELRDRMGDEGRARVTAHFTAAQFAARVGRALDLDPAPVAC
jgi:phosphatidyl-myo-inositol dimannoside synthase